MQSIAKESIICCKNLQNHIEYWLIKGSKLKIPELKMVNFNEQD